MKVRSCLLEVGLFFAQIAIFMSVISLLRNVADDASSVTSSTKSKQPVVPLCWSDQVERQDTIVKASSRPKTAHVRQVNKLQL